jgi:hypothetical protein
MKDLYSNWFGKSIKETLDIEVGKLEKLSSLIWK